MKGVLFDHTFHEKNTKTCRSCHHESLEACRKCHGLTGSAEGGWLNLANAYHDPFYDIGCAGCHKKSKTDKKCTGCPIIWLILIYGRKGRRRICMVCHSGKKEGLIQAGNFSRIA